MTAWPSTPGEQLSQAIYVAAELGLADLLAAGPQPVADLAAAVGAHAPSLARVLRLLASEGVFVEEENGRFALTPMAAALGREAGPLRLQVLVLGHDTSWRAAGGLLHTVRTGEPAFTHVHGVDFFAHYRQHPDEGARFDQLMAAATAPQARAVAAAYDFAPFGTIVDVGGGRGALLLAILATSPRPRGIVFDQPVVAGGRGR